MSIFTQEIERGLQEIANFLEEDIRNILIEDGHEATGELVKSIKNTVSTGGGFIGIEGTMLIYGGAIIKGRQPGTKRVPVDALVDWINAKKFSKGAKETRGLAFRIQQSIFEKGIKPNDFIEKAFNKNEAKISAKLSEVVKVAFDISISNLINNAKQFA